MMKPVPTHARWDEERSKENQRPDAWTLKSIVRRLGDYKETITLTPFGTIHIRRADEREPAPSVFPVYNYERSEDYGYDGKLHGLMETGRLLFCKYTGPRADVRVEATVPGGPTTTTYEFERPVTVLEAFGPPLETAHGKNLPPQEALDRNSLGWYQSQCDSRHAKWWQRRQPCPFKPTFIDEALQMFAPLPEPQENPILKAIRSKAEGSQV